MKTKITYRPAYLLFFALASCTTDVFDTESLSSDKAGPSLTEATSAGPDPGSHDNSEAGVITAGEWNDLHEWAFWTNLMKSDVHSAHRHTWGFHPAHRYSFSLKERSGQPLVNAQIILKDQDGKDLWSARSDNSGNAELWSGLFAEGGSPASAIVIHGEQTFTIEDVMPFDQGTNEVTVPAAASSADVVDVMLIVDATGSMGDELEYLKKELYDVLQRAKDATALPLRTASVFYRDDGDEYVTRSTGFTTSVNTTVEFVKKQVAGGGGDFPEAVHTALHVAIEQGSWSPEARARILFLILDAPPHEHADVKKAMRELTRNAAEKGIKIIPITASGIDKSTEFLMRFLSISTNGTYVFITNHSGIGNPHLDPTIGEYEVEYLNNLMVRLIRKYTE